MFSTFSVHYQSITLVDLVDPPPMGTFYMKHALGEGTFFMKSPVLNHKSTICKEYHSFFCLNCYLCDLMLGETGSLYPCNDHFASNTNWASTRKLKFQSLSFFMSIKIQKTIEYDICRKKNILYRTRFIIPYRYSVYLYTE